MWFYKCSLDQSLYMKNANWFSMQHLYITEYDSLILKVKPNL